MLSSHVRSFFKHFLTEAQQVGLWISVVTFSGQTQLIADAMAIALGGESNIKRCYLRGEDGGFGAVGDGGLLPNGTQLGKGGRGGNMFSSNTFQYPPESGSDGMIIIQY